MKPLVSDILPTQTERLLLQAILADEKEAKESYLIWSKSVNIESLDYGVSRMLPLLFSRLQKWRIHDSQSGKIKGLVKKCWLQNQLFMRGLLPILDAFEQNKIPLVALKGLAMCLGVYHNFTSRAMQDIDLLIPLEKVETAIQILQKSGFDIRESYVSNPSDFLKVHHSLGFENHNHTIIDIHTYILEECCCDGDDHPFHKEAQITRYCDRSIPILRHEELLFHTIAHGMRWHPNSPIRWIPDAVAIIRHSPIDWRIISEYAKKYELVHPLSIGLKYLHQEFELSIPEEMFSIDTTKEDERRFLFHLNQRNGLISSVKNHYRHYQSTHNQGFFSFLQSYWGTPNRKHLIFQAARKCWKKIRK